MTKGEMHIQWIPTPKHESLSVIECAPVAECESRDPTLLSS